MRNLRSKATGSIIPRETLQLISAGVGLAISLRMIYGAVKFHKLMKIEKKVDIIAKKVEKDV